MKLPFFLSSVAFVALTLHLTCKFHEAWRKGWWNTRRWVVYGSVSDFWRSLFSPKLDLEFEILEKWVQNIFFSHFTCYSLAIYKVKLHKTFTTCSSIQAYFKMASLDFEVSKKLQKFPKYDNFFIIFYDLLTIKNIL